jgi:hypothetical protein
LKCCASLGQGFFYKLTISPYFFKGIFQESIEKKQALFGAPAVLIPKSPVHATGRGFGEYRLLYPAQNAGLFLCGGYIKRENPAYGEFLGNGQSDFPAIRVNQDYTSLVDDLDVI